MNAATHFERIRIEHKPKEIWVMTFFIPIRQMIIHGIEPKPEQGCIKILEKVIYPYDKDIQITIPWDNKNFDFKVSWENNLLSFKSQSVLPEINSPNPAVWGALWVQFYKLGNQQDEGSLGMSLNLEPRLDRELNQIWENANQRSLHFATLLEDKSNKVKRRSSLIDPKRYRKEELNEVISHLSYREQDELLINFLETTIKSQYADRVTKLDIVEDALKEAVSQFFSVRIDSIEHPKVEPSELAMDAFLLFLSLPGSTSLLNYSIKQIIEEVASRGFGKGKKVTLGLIAYLKKRHAQGDQGKPNNNKSKSKLDDIRAILTSVNSHLNKVNGTKPEETKGVDLSEWDLLRKNLSKLGVLDPVQAFSASKSTAEHLGKYKALKSVLSHSDSPQVMIQRSIHTFIRKEKAFYRQASITTEMIAKDALYLQEYRDLYIVLLASIAVSQKSKSYDLDDITTTTEILSLHFEFLMWSLYTGPFIKKVNYLPPSFQIVYGVSSDKGRIKSHDTPLVGDEAEIESTDEKKTSKIDYISTRFYPLFFEDEDISEEYKKAKIAEKLRDEYNRFSSIQGLAKDGMSIFKHIKDEQEN